MSRRPEMRTQPNARTSDGLHRVAEALATLDSMEVSVHAVTVINGRPSLLVEAPGGLPNAVRMLERSQGRREALWIASVAGCRVEYRLPEGGAVTTTHAAAG